MKENSVLHVLMYLFQNHMQGNCIIKETDTDIVEELESVGFVLPTINRAIGWLASLSEENKDAYMTPPTANSFRIYSEYERELLDTECIAYLLELEEQQILTAAVREMVIHQAIELQSEGIDLSLIKWVILMVLFNQPQHEEALKRMELLILDNPFGGLH